MTDKHARAKFYASLRSVAKNYQWDCFGGAIRGHYIDPKTNRSSWRMFCPLTAAAQGEKSRYVDRRFRLNQFIAAGKELGMPEKSSVMIAESADNKGKYFNKQVRQALLRAVGLAK